MSSLFTNIKKNLRSTKKRSTKKLSTKKLSTKKRSTKKRSTKKRSTKKRSTKKFSIKKSLSKKHSTFDKKTAKLHRKMSKEYCIKTPCNKMGFSQKSSCRYYKNCYK